MSPHLHVPDHLVVVSLLLESILLGHESPEEGIVWAEENGYIETGIDDEGDECFRVLDAGREHVASRVIVPEWN